MLENELETIKQEHKRQELEKKFEKKIAGTTKTPRTRCIK
jgi:hypothetical protein